MKAQRRKVLPTDNCSAHSNIPRNSGQVKGMFLPPNYTSILQPPKQGTNGAAKTHYRSRFVRRMLANISVHHDEKVNTLDALQKLTADWKKPRRYNGVKWRKADILSVTDEMVFRADFVYSTLPAHHHLPFPPLTPTWSLLIGPAQFLPHASRLAPYPQTSSPPTTPPTQTRVRDPLLSEQISYTVSLRSTGSRIYCTTFPPRPA
jgi:hypothetical protein